jgi:hypothetical protein
MDLTSHIPALIEGKAQVPELMQESSTVACMGSRALLSLFVCAAPFPESLVGAVTTEAEALELVSSTAPPSCSPPNGWSRVMGCHSCSTGIGSIRRCAPC